MNTVKNCGNVKYILYPWTSVEWARVQGMYVVNPRFEADFIRRLRSYPLVS